MLTRNFITPRILGSALAAVAVLVPLPSLADTTTTTTTSGSTGSSAPGSVAIVFSPSLTSVRSDSKLPQEQGLSADRKFGMGAGILFDAPLSDGLSLGVGALYIERKFQIGTGTTRVQRKAPTVFVPVEAKVWLGNGFSIGGGAFGAVKVGDAKDEIVTGSTTLQSTSAQDRKSLDYGLTASVNFLLPVSGRTGLLLGARYLYGLSNNTRNSAIYNEKIDDLAFTAGLSFSI